MSDAPRSPRAKLAPGAKLIIALVLGMLFSMAALVIAGAAALIIRLFQWAILKC
jgi:hypothetical protein